MPKTYIPGGYILLSRRLIESEIWDKPPIYLKVWIYILNKARHEAEGAYERGELLLSIPELQEVCSYKVGFRKETPSKKQIFNILEFLRNPYEGDYERDDEGNVKDGTKETMIETRKTTRGLIVKVCNYNVYQDPKNYKKTYEGNDESNKEAPMKGMPEETMNGTRGEHYTQEFKELKNVNKDIRARENDSNESYTHVDKSKDEFNEKFSKFYDLYAKKKARPKAEQAFKKALKKHDFETIMNGTQEFLKSIKPEDKQYQPFPATFLNQERYMDDYEPVNENVIDGGAIDSNEPAIQKRHPKKKSHGIDDLERRIALSNER